MIIMIHVRIKKIKSNNFKIILISARKARVFYHGHTSTLCDICEREDCENACILDPETRTATEDGKGSVASLEGSWLCVLIVTYFVVMYF